MIYYVRSVVTMWCICCKLSLFTSLVLCFVTSSYSAVSILYQFVTPVAHKNENKMERAVDLLLEKKNVQTEVRRLCAANDPTKGETAVNDCHCWGDMVVHIRKVMAITPFSSPEPLGLICNRPRNDGLWGRDGHNARVPQC